MAIGERRPQLRLQLQLRLQPQLCQCQDFWSQRGRPLVLGSSGGWGQHSLAISKSLLWFNLIRRSGHSEGYRLKIKPPLGPANLATTASWRPLVLDRAGGRFALSSWPAPSSSSDKNWLAELCLSVLKLCVSWLCLVLQTRRGPIVVCAFWGRLSIKWPAHIGLYLASSGGLYALESKREPQGDPMWRFLSPPLIACVSQRA